MCDIYILVIQREHFMCFFITFIDIVAFKKNTFQFALLLV